MPSSSKLVELRSLLHQQYPDAHRSLPSSSSLSSSPDSSEPSSSLESSAPVSPSGIPSSSADPGAFLSLHGALRLARFRNRITEINSAHACPGFGLVLHHLLEQAQQDGQGLALVDGCDHFDPQSYTSLLSRNLFWARCRDVESALKITDLFLRDGNLPLVILDLAPGAAPMRSSIRASIWYRFRHLSEQSGSGLCLFSHRALIPSPHFRFELESGFALDSLEMPRRELMQQLKLRVQRAPLPIPALPEPGRQIA